MQRASFGRRGTRPMEPERQEQATPEMDTFLYGCATFLIAGVLITAVLLLA